MAQPTAANSGPAIASPVDWNNFGAPALLGTSAQGRQYWNNTINIQTGTNTSVPSGTPLTAAMHDQPIGVNVSALLSRLSDPDANGFHTIVLNGANDPKFPADPVYSTLTLKAVALESYLVINNYNISADAVIKGVDGTTSTTRRQIVDMAKCDTCHERIGFHSNAGRANNAEYCATCHNSEITSSNLFAGFANYPVATPPKLTYFSQRPNNFKDMVHSIHAGEMRKEQNKDDPFNFLRGNPLGTGGSGPMIFENVVYPARQYDCQTCHKPNTYGVPAIANLAWSAVDATAALGSANLAAGQTGAAAGVYDPLKTVRIGPAQAACGSCHNSTSAKTHYLVNSTSTGESCNVCHGAGAEFAAHTN